MVFLCFAPLAMALETGQDASLVLGQSVFTTQLSEISQTGMSSPISVAIDPTTDKVFVCDHASNRILRFSSLEALANGNPAEAKLGQATWTEGNENGGAGSGNPQANTFDHPWQIAVDAAGRLWVADRNNNRVLRFDNASSKGNNAAADGVLGQDDFTSCGENKGGGEIPGQCTLRNPMGVAVDNAGRLWVADLGNNRVLRFDNAAAKPNGDDSDGVLGQLDFTTAQENQGNPQPSANTLHTPFGLCADSDGRLWVADTYNHRVLRYDNAASKSNGGDADGVLGQIVMINGTPLTLMTMRLMFPRGMTMSIEGTLYVSDYDDSRIMIFPEAATKPNGQGAFYVLGQADFNGDQPNRGLVSPTANTLSYPNLPTYHDATRTLWVPDSDNNRVLRYSEPLPTVTLTAPTGITATGFRSGGEVTDSGGNAVLAKGVCVNTKGNPTLADKCTDDGGGSGTFISDVSGLSPGTKYYVRSYATTIAGTGYCSGQATLRTLQPVPVFPHNKAWILGAFALLLMLSGLIWKIRRSG